MSGGYDLAVIVEGKDLYDVANFVAEKLSTLGGVLSTATHFQLSVYKHDGVLLAPVTRRIACRSRHEPAAQDGSGRKISDQLRGIPRSGIRDFFELVIGRADVISLGVGEPDLPTPWHIREAAIHSLEKGQTSYTSNLGLESLRIGIADTSRSTSASATIRRRRSSSPSACPRRSTSPSARCSIPATR